MPQNYEDSQTSGGKEFTSFSDIGFYLTTV